MASLRAHLYALMVRLGVRLRFRGDPDLATIRAALDKEAFPAPAGVAFRPDTLGGVPGEWALAGEDRPDRPRLLYLHGGGFITCSPRSHRPITGSFARAGFRVFAPEYRLAPEHPFPAGLHDAVDTWTALSAEGPAAVGGDSAGGNLALGVMIEARRRGLRMPAAAVLFSPAADLLGRGASYRENARRDAMFNREALERLVPLYLRDVEPSDPRVSPIEADLAGLPPLFIHAAEREMMRDDSVCLAERARAAGVPVELTIWPVVPHAWQLAERFVPEARRSLDEATAFLHRTLARDVAGTRSESVP